MNEQPIPLMHSPPGAETVIDGRPFLYFVGTGYLGLQGRPEVIRAACEAAQRYGVGSATTRAGYGTTPPLVEVERLAAELLAAESAFHFPTGYAGNRILTAALADAFDLVLLDELSHYCVVEAAQSTGRPVFRFSHCDPAALRAALDDQLKPAQRPLVMTDGVFAARGDIAPLADYQSVLGDYPARCCWSMTPTAWACLASTAAGHRNMPTWTMTVGSTTSPTTRATVRDYFPAAR